jgi:hypothetical protein
MLRPLLLLLFATAAHAAPPSVDWARGLVVAEGIGLADRHAPNPAVARGTSRRDAEIAARKLLASKVSSLPVATGGTVADKAKDKAVAARIERAVVHAVVVAADPETDGAWRVTLGVPVEAIRQAIEGPRVLAVAAQDSGPAVVVVEALARVTPAVGWMVGGIAAPTVWMAAEALPAWAKDAPRVKAKGAKAGAIEVAGISGTTATLFVILTPK